MLKKLTKKSVERRLQRLIERYGLGGVLSIEKIKSWIFDDYGDSAMDATNRFQKKFLNYFKDIDDINEALQAAVDAWNFYPHKSLKGKSPQQMVQRALRDNSELRRKKNDKMPDVIAGGKKLSWNKHWAMIRKIEQIQKPFKQQIEKEISPLYRKFLIQEKKLSEEAVEEHMKVADIFFERVLWVGFLSYEMIRPEFVQYEFPRWWQTHVLFDNRDENKIWSSLQILLSFMKEKFNLEIKDRQYK